LFIQCSARLLLCYALGVFNRWASPWLSTTSIPNHSATSHLEHGVRHGKPSYTCLRLRLRLRYTLIGRHWLLLSLLANLLHTLLLTLLLESHQASGLLQLLFDTGLLPLRTLS